MEAINFRDTKQSIKIIKEQVTYHILKYTYQRKGKLPKIITESFSTVKARNDKYEKYLFSATRNNFKLYTEHFNVPVDMVIKGDD